MRRLLVLLILLLVAGAQTGAQAGAQTGAQAVVPPVPTPPSEADPVGVWPLDPEPTVVAGFDAPEETWGKGHRGVDLAGRFGQPVRAAMAGTITHVGVIAGRGTVTVGHGPTRTTYEPVAATVTKGDDVRAGQVIGTLARVGSHCFPRVCLHWGWIRGETYLDPLRLVGGGPIRLLPLERDRPVPTGVGGDPPPRRTVVSAEAAGVLGAALRVGPAAGATRAPYLVMLTALEVAALP